MSMVSCHLIVHNSQAYQMRQVFAGFIELQSQGAIRLTKELREDSATAYLEVVVNGLTRLVYDLQDSGFLFVPDLDWTRVDHYFKRSFEPRVALSVSDRVQPLGLNYVVNSRHGLIRGPERVRSMTTLARRLRELCLGPGFTLETFETPARRIRDVVCFMTRLWDPADPEVESESVRQEREDLNAFRIACIRHAKKAYGATFIGGVIDSPYARRCCSDCILTDPRQTRRHRYLDTVRSSAVCVTTSGLHGSTSWKFGEYVAMGKAIVSEPLHYAVPGELAAGRHYMTFSTVEQLQAAIDLLRNDMATRSRMEEDNRRYYWNWLRADRLITKTLQAAGIQLGAASVGPERHSAFKLTRPMAAQ